MNLDRFLTAQQGIYESAMEEIQAGSKHGHWMWFIFPQLIGLGLSSTAQRYAINDLDEATAYLSHPVLGTRLISCCEGLLRHSTRTAREILGFPDDLKLRSCVTLFDQVRPQHPVFGQVLAAFYHGQPDPKTLELLGLEP